MWVLGMMYEKSETLRRFDQVLITKREFDNVIVWNEYIHAQDTKKLNKQKKFKPNEKNIRNYPPEKKEKSEEEKKANS